MSVKLLTEHHLEFLNLKKATQAHLGLHTQAHLGLLLSKCHIVGNHISRLNYVLYTYKAVE